MDPLTPLSRYETMKCLLGSWDVWYHHARSVSGCRHRYVMVSNDKAKSIQ